MGRQYLYLRGNFITQILLYIFQFLPQTSLKRLCLVNKALAWEASKFLWGRGINLDFCQTHQTRIIGKEALECRLQWLLQVENRDKLSLIKILRVSGCESSQASNYNALRPFFEPRLLEVYWPEDRSLNMIQGNV